MSPAAVAKPRDHVEVALQYARDVIAGRVPASRRARAACQRHLRDLERADGEHFPYYFDEHAARKVCRFAEMFAHVKGRWALRTPDNDPRFRAQPWQAFFLCVLFGWKRKSDGTRRFRKASLYVPRKNGKSFLAAVIALFLAFVDGEPGAEVYSGATTEKQALEVFTPARRMALDRPEFLEAFNVEVYAKSLVRMADGSKLEPVIGKPGDGSSPHGAIVDEFHEHDTSELYDTMLTGMGARRQPLLLVITTAGTNLASPCYDDYKTCCSILDGVLHDEEHFALVYEVDAGVDWTTDAALAMANPNLGVSVDADFLRSRRADALVNARKQSTFKIKHLNVWVHARDAFVNMERWHACAEPFDIEPGRDMVLALDLASKTDLAALVALALPTDADPVHRALARFYLPSATVRDPSNEHYFKWREEQWLEETDGEIIDYEFIYRDVLELCERFRVTAIAYDPYQATMFVNRLQADGLPALEFRQTVLNMSEPMKQAEAMIRAGTIRHDGNPVLTWCVANVEARVDAKDNVYPRKSGERQENKIDGFVALVMALGTSMRAAANDGDGDWNEFLANPLKVGR